MPKNLITPSLIMNQVAVSSTTAFPSQVETILMVDNIGIVPIVVSGTPSGTFAVQVSNDGTNFQPLTLAAVPTITTGTLTNVPISISNCPFAYLKLVYTNSSGSGVISANLCAKGI